MSRKSILLAEVSEQRKNQRILIAAGGTPDLPPPDAPWDLVVAVDHGGDLLWQWDIEADTIIGDLDSLSPEAMKHHLEQGAELVRFPTDKNETDLELALVSLPDGPSNEVYITNLWGGRFDHTIMNLLLMTRFSRKGLFLFPTTDGTGGVMGPGRLVVTAPLQTGTGLIALSKQAGGLTSQGVRWPLSNETLAFGESRGVSNLLVHSPWKVSLSSGSLLWMLSGVSRADVEIEWLPAVT